MPVQRDTSKSHGKSERNSGGWNETERVAKRKNVLSALSPRECGWQPDRRQQRAQITASTKEAARTCREVSGRAAALLTAADWPPGQSRATSCSPIYHRPTCTTLHHAHGDIITFSISLLKTSPVKSKNDMKSNNSGGHGDNNNTSKRSFSSENWSCIHTIYQSSTGLLRCLHSQ